MSLKKYQKKELQQHIYDTPDTYVGGIDKINEILPIKDGEKIVFKEIEYIPALLNIFNEIYEILSEKESENITGVFHCFSGTYEEALKIILDQLLSNLRRA